MILLILEMLCSKSLAEIQAIPKNKPAAFDGFLIPEYEYRQLMIRAYTSKDAKSELQQCLEDKPIIPESYAVEWFGAGTLFGGIFIFVLSHPK
jgi:hypothetical protein